MAAPPRGLAIRESLRAAIGELIRSAPRARAVDRAEFSVLFLLCDLSGRGVRRFFPHAEDAKDAKAGAGAPWQGRPSRRVGTDFGRSFLRLNEHVAGQGRCTEPPFALRTCALEFWIFRGSGLGGR